MKKPAYFLFVFMVITLSASLAKAQDGPCVDGDPTSTGCPTSGGSTAMPITNGANYLLIAGAAVGVAAISKRKQHAVKA